MTMTSESIITYDYDFSPYGQKIRLVLALAGIPYKRVDVPVVLPRPQLEAIDVTYRRIPVLAVGKDLYADSTLIIDKIAKLQGPNGKLHVHPADAAFDVWGTSLFNTALPLIPDELLTPEFVKDRLHIFPILARQDLKDLRPSTSGAFAALLSTIENEFLSSGYPYIGGRKEPSTADAHVAWSTKFVLMSLGIGKQPGFTKEDWPKTYAWLESLPDGGQPEAVEPEEAKKIILGSKYAEESPQTRKGDALQQYIGQNVNVENADTDPGKFPQAGKLIAANILEAIIELPNGIRLHFPRTGYYFKPQH